MNKIIFIILVLLSLEYGDNRIVYKGNYIYGHEVDSFVSLDKKHNYWAEYGTSVKKTLSDFYLKNTTKPYESIYIEFEGVFKKYNGDAFASDYDGIVKIEKIIHLSKTKNYFLGTNNK